MKIPENMKINDQISSTQPSGTHLLCQQIFTEPWLCTRHSAGSWAHKDNSAAKYLISRSIISINSIVLPSLSKIRLQTIDMICLSVSITGYNTSCSYSFLTSLQIFFFWLIFKFTYRCIIRLLTVFFFIHFNSSIIVI